MACLRVLRAYANFDTTRMLLSKSSRCCSPSPTALVCGRVLEPDRISRFVTLVSGARSSVRAGLKRSSGGVVGSWDLFVSPKLDAVRSKVSVGDKHLASSGVRHVSGIGRSCAEHGEMGSTSAVAANGGVETAAKPRRYAVLTTGQFPSPEELQMYDGFVVTGSRHDAHGDEEWIEKLCGVLRHINYMRKKSLCVCFGHQVLSRALGGKTGRAPIGWEVGLREISLTNAFFSKSYAAGVPPKLKVLEVHRDQVMEIPPGAELLASSGRTGIEMFAMGEHALAIQGHPEFFEDVVVDLLEGRLAPMMTEAEKKLAEESLSKGKPDQKTWYQLCKTFLKGRNE
ncbi:gamma-glutamyl peptidase 5 isoform X2 [Physcomitrium patens]|uniref:Glutamine amidotransferase domain-containing protein n=1 Tax=Physcomitrium patens TaxID=3218 RepID=A0A7I4EB38_PHYPA|nr:gamma-glutamyl peptidase 5-like isoform X2 [Physcomitrium patens]|eukprot:XP_024383093.1 gamma-glutamyl peptidase 5-like isoform X2 [Physcomitrella patens]